MKATGIVRRIDDLGRVVIPKEIRRTLCIREGAPLEIFTGREGEIVLKKYSPLGEIHSFAEQYAESLSQTAGILVCITDMEKIIAASGTGKKEMLEKEISEELMDAAEGRRPIIAEIGQKEYIAISKAEQTSYQEEIIYPILSGGDVIGSVIFLSREKGKEREVRQKLAACAAMFLGSQMEA